MKIRITWLAAGLIAAAVSFTSGSAAAQSTFTPLGLLPGGSNSQALGVSADGVVVVGHSFPGEAFRWTSADGLVGLGDLPGGISGSSRADDASADGAVIVGRGYSASGLEAFRWTEADGVMNGLGDLEDGSFLSVAYGVSADGAVVVGYSSSANGKEAFRWANGSMVGLGHLGGITFSSEAHAVSADGAVVVGRSLSVFGLEAFRWANGSMVGLGDLDGGTFSSVAEGVSPDGEIVVGYGNSANGREAFLWTEGGGMAGLGDLEGGNFFSVAKDVSADGAVIVGGATSALGGEAFRWTEADGMQSLQDLLEARGVDLTGWLLGSAEAVSDDGTTIVGHGINPDGNGEAWVAFLAPVDMTGSWNATLDEGANGTCDWEVNQDGTNVFVDAWCELTGAGSVDGTINVVGPGYFDVAGQYEFGCTDEDSASAQGTVVGDEINDGAWQCKTPGGAVVEGTFTATRVRDFVISADGGDCERLRFDGTWDGSTCTVADLTILAGESLTIDEGATLVSTGSMTFNGGSANGRNLKVFGTLTNNGDMTFIGGDGDQSAQLQVVGGTLTNNALMTMTFVGGDGLVSASLATASEATITNNGEMEFIGGAGVGSGRFAHNSGEILNNCDATIDVSATQLLNNATIIDRGTIYGTVGPNDAVKGACPEDMTTERSIWDLDLTGGLGGTCGYKATQTGTHLTVEAQCDTAGPGSFTGTIDPDTGVFSVDGGYRDACTVSASAGGTVVGNSILGGTWTCVEPAGTDLCPGPNDCVFTGTFTGGRVDDTDDDFVADSGDNCDFNANPHQENSSGNDFGDMCDPWTINAIWQKGASFHASTPFYRLRVPEGASSDGIEFSVEAGLGATRERGIGVPEADDSQVINLLPGPVYGLADDPLNANTSATLQQSSWHTIMSPDLYNTGQGYIRFHSVTHANGFSMGYEINLDEIPEDADVEIAYFVDLPVGWSWDESELTDDNNQPVPGRLTIKDGNDPQVRISPTHFAALGKKTVLQDKQNIFNGIENAFIELDDQLQPCDPQSTDPELCGFGLREGLFSDLLQTEYTFEENQADSANARTTVTPFFSGYLVSMVVDAELIDRNRNISKIILVGQTWSSLTPVDFPPDFPKGQGQVVTGRHIVAFDEEVNITGENATLVLENTLADGCLPDDLPTFDCRDADYSLLPNEGGTARHVDWLGQGQTAVRHSGGNWEWTGDSTIRFNGGGAGVAISAGNRVGAAHPCLEEGNPEHDPVDDTANTGRCKDDRGKRGSFTAETLLIEGSMGGLAAAESDITIGELTFYQDRDPNVTENIALHAAGGVSCTAHSGVLFGQNPSSGVVLSNVPLDLAEDVSQAFDFKECTCGEWVDNVVTRDCYEQEVESGLCLAGFADCTCLDTGGEFKQGRPYCSALDIGKGDCLPYPLSSPPGTGICNFEVLTMRLHGMASANNLLDPLGDNLAVPAGCAVTLAPRAGKGQIGAKSYDPVTDTCKAGEAAGGAPDSSSVEGFDCGMMTAGGANVVPETGEYLAFTDPRAVPPNVYCVDAINFVNNETGVVVAPNSDLRVSGLDISGSKYFGFSVGNGGANVEDVETTPGSPPCPSIDPDGFACRAPAEELSCPACKKGGLSYLAVVGAGKSAPAKLSIKRSNIVSPDPNPALPPLTVDPDTLVAEKEGLLTIFRRPGSLAKLPIHVWKGADTIVQPGLVSIEVSGSNIEAVVDGPVNSTAAIAVDQYDSPGAENYISLVSICYLNPDDPEKEECLPVVEDDTSLVAVVSTFDGGGDPGTGDVNENAMTQAALVVQEAGPDVPGDHKCYGVRAKGAISIDAPVTLRDPLFEDYYPEGVSNATVLQPFEFCNPAREVTELLRDPEAHLTCYDLSEETPALPTVVVGGHALGGEEDTVPLGQANRLCVPAIKNDVGGHLSDLQARLNHFKCYERARRAPKGTRNVVELADEFFEEGDVMTVKEGPFLVCNAVDKNGEGIVEGDGVAQHLACFKIQSQEGGRKPVVRTVEKEDQFSAVPLDVDKEKLLCVPATVEVASP